jgi:mono/diheme cytochrome c family protein
MLLPIHLTRNATLWAALALASAACSGAPEHAPEPTPEPVRTSAPVTLTAVDEDEDEDTPTGKSLYQRHCAGCHNDNGDGRGATMLAQGAQARSFAQGGFAFGNTPQAIFQTISSGIPGSSLMQPFSSQMDEQERRLVADYVLTLTPYGNPVLAAGSIFVVQDRALFARGKLPALRDGLPERPRALMVGVPGGLSFEYRSDDVRLLAVRRGGFVDRTDWNERGGGFLKPLGALVFEFEAGDPGPWLRARIDGQLQPLALELAATRTVGRDDQEAQIELQQGGVGPRCVRRIVETVFRPDIAIADAFGRRIVIDAVPAAPELLATLCSFDQAGTWERGAPPAAAGTSGELWPLAEDGWVVARNGEAFDCWFFQPAPLLRWVHADARWSVVLPRSPGPSHGPSSASLVVVRVPQWDPTLLQSLAKELAR